jgi:hypothetical protein
VRADFALSLTISAEGLSFRLTQRALKRANVLSAPTLVGAIWACVRPVSDADADRPSQVEEESPHSAKNKPLAGAEIQEAIVA